MNAKGVSDVPEEEEEETQTTRMLEGKPGVLSFTAEEYTAWCLPWMNSLIIKVLGASFPTYFICDHINRMWHPKDPLKLIPLSNGYYIVSFSNKEDRDYAFQEGPWMIEDHYLIVQRWCPNFNPWKADLQRNIAAWIRLPDVPLEFYNVESLRRIGNMQPLLPTYTVFEEERPIIYEGLHQVCFTCGKYGHQKDSCPMSQKEDEVQSNGKRHVEEVSGGEGGKRMEKRAGPGSGSTIVTGDEASSECPFGKSKILRQDFRGSTIKAETGEGINEDLKLNTEETDSEPWRPTTPNKEVEWVPLEKHTVFVTANNSIDGDSGVAFSRNLVAWDGSSRLYFWEPKSNCLHRLSLRLGDPEPTSVLAASPSKVMRADMEINFAIQKISINRNGSALLLFGSERLCVMYLYGRTSKKDVNLICRTIIIGSQTYSKSSNDIRVLKALWHPYSDCHVGILSSDSVFRLFNLALDPLQPEQEYYLQPVDPVRSRSASSMCPADFSFGGDHLWDKFSVFILFGDGSIYILCPVVPFGSLFKSESVQEIYNDAHIFGLKDANSKAASNSKLAISWLEATFPELQNQETEESMSLMRAHAYAQFDASLTLQGPLRRVGMGGSEDSVGRSAECEGRAVSFLYDLVIKDTILVTSWSGGQLQIDALADEIQPVWSAGIPSRLRVDSHGNILGLAMICESITSGFTEKLDHTVWLGNPPPLLRLAIVDLALPRRAESGYNISLFVDPLMPERIYSLHDGGVDSIVLHFLPFTSQANGKDDKMRTPSVHPVLNTCQSGSTTASPLCGFSSLSDSFGYSWIVAVTLSQECIVLETKTWNLLLPPNVDMEKKPILLEDKSEERDIPTIISKELLSGPRTVLVPQASPSLRSILPDSIEGRSALHQYFKLFHETYVEYAHKVYLELKHHAPQLKKIVDDQQARLGDAQLKLLKVAEKQPVLEKRINRAVQMHSSLKERLQQLRNLPGVHKKPLSKAEQQFKSELDHFREVELVALHSSVDALGARLRRYMQASKANSHQKEITGRKSYVDKAQISMLKSSLDKLSLLNSENSKKVKLVESSMRARENGGRESSLPKP
ncbi:hypothetical protein K1719_044530 [Acacia pycnantha]|nr:hypothetical protein K1719_044530 [Acacia pycnantha]